MRLIWNVSLFPRVGGHPNLVAFRSLRSSRLGQMGATLALALATLLGWQAHSAPAADYVVVFGGGPRLQNSEYSLERNVVLFRQTMPRLRLVDPQLQVLFGSGNEAGSPDVSVGRFEPLPDSFRLVADLFKPSGDTIDIDYRHHELEDVVSSCRKRAVLDTLRDLGGRVKPGDRVLIYNTGHGGKGDPVENGHFYTWGDERVSVREFTEVLDEYPVDVPVLVIMVHCYSGAFANLIFKGGDPVNGLADHPRAGFFATTDSLPAAGCTPDINVENYQEYSSDFWAALGGRDRIGRVVRADDLNGDGWIDSAEAHAHVVTSSTTIDLPVKTSDTLVRVWAARKGLERNDRQVKPLFSVLVAQADPLESHALESLCRDLDLKGEDRLEAIPRRLDETKRLESEIARQLKRKESELGRARRSVADAIAARWPFLKTGWHPETHRVLAGDRPEVIEAIRAHPSFKTWQRLAREVKELQTRITDSERTVKRLERVKRLAETIQLTQAVLGRVEPQERERYWGLRRLEASLIGTSFSDLVPAKLGGQ